MDKLLELLNEYSVVLWDRYSGVTGEEEPKKWGYGITGPDNPGRYIFYSGASEINQTYLISKDFGFIKWLVENDKIDFSWEGKLSSDLVALFERKVDNAEGVIALLSISNTPIDDLISYLKIS